MGDEDELFDDGIVPFQEAHNDESGESDADVAEDIDSNEAAQGITIPSGSKGQHTHQLPLPYTETIQCPLPESLVQLRKDLLGDYKLPISSRTPRQSSRVIQI